MLQPTVSHLLTLIFIVSTTTLVVDAKNGRHRSRNNRVGCAPCDKRECPLVTPETCEGGQVRKDQCDCCPVCATASEDHQPIVISDSNQLNQTRVLDFSAKNACANIECAKHQVCIPNIQNIPMCRCPSRFFCRHAKSSIKDEVCGENGLVYKNRCYLEVDECEQHKKIRTVNKNACPGSTLSLDRPRERQKNRQQERQSQRREDKQAQKMGKRKGNRQQVLPPSKAERLERKKERGDKRAEKTSKKDKVKTTKKDKKKTRKEKRQRRREEKLRRRF